ncbi:MAG: EamA family transporter [Spirochaetaceae bacterium]
MNGYWALMLMVILTTTGQLLVKRGSASIDFAGGIRRGVVSMANPYTISGAAAVAGAPLLYMYALSKLSLSVAYGFSGLSYLGVVAAGRLFLGERITLYHISGSLVILAGLALWNGPSIFL